jgi:cytochrome b subunit of formate dehydrogenase
MRTRKTDYGTVVLHWILVAALAVAFMTGLRIATETPGRAWINRLDGLLPQQSAWTLHMQAGVILATVTVAYIIYLVKSGLKRRVELDATRLQSLRRGGSARWGAFNVILYWVFFISMLVLIVTGGSLYLSYSAGTDALLLHWYASWVLPGFLLLHVLSHYAAGGVAQLLRIMRPAPLTRPPAPLDAVELMLLLVEHTAASETRLQPAEPEPEPRHASRPYDPFASVPSSASSPRMDIHDRPPPRRSSIVQSNPFVVAAAVALASGGLLIAADSEATDTLHVHRIRRIDIPLIDGDTSDKAWRTAKPFSVVTTHGANFDGGGETRIDIRAVHDGSNAYFLFTWSDPTRSLKQMPLIKTDMGWQLLHPDEGNADRQQLSEDKLSVLFTPSSGVLAGDNTFHAGPRPLAGAPATTTGRGLHYTGGGYADVWLWKATSSGPVGWMDDMHFGPPLEAPQQVSNATPAYRGGFAPDPGSTNYADNFLPLGHAADDDDMTLTPRRLPKDVAATTFALGQIDADPNRGESERARWYMTEEDSVPYDPERDRRIARGTVLPGVVIAGNYSGDRADIRCAARWASGYWSLEVTRRLDTGSQYDVPIKSGVSMRVAAFDHSRIEHTRHVRPIRLELE